MQQAAPPAQQALLPCGGGEWRGAARWCRPRVRGADQAARASHQRARPAAPARALRLQQAWERTAREHLPRRTRSGRGCAVPRRREETGAGARQAVRVRSRSPQARLGARALCPGTLWRCATHRGRAAEGDDVADAQRQAAVSWQRRVVDLENAAVRRVSGAVRGPSQTREARVRGGPRRGPARRARNRAAQTRQEHPHRST